MAVTCRLSAILLVLAGSSAAFGEAMPGELFPDVEASAPQPAPPIKNFPPAAPKKAEKPPAAPAGSKAVTASESYRELGLDAGEKKVTSAKAAKEFAKTLKTQATKSAGDHELGALVAFKAAALEAKAGDFEAAFQTLRRIESEQPWKTLECQAAIAQLAVPAARAAKDAPARETWARRALDACDAAAATGELDSALALLQQCKEPAAGAGLEGPWKMRFAAVSAGREARLAVVALRKKLIASPKDTGAARDLLAALLLAGDAAGARHAAERAKDPVLARLAALAAKAGSALSPAEAAELGAWYAARKEIAGRPAAAARAAACFTRAAQAAGADARPALEEKARTLSAHAAGLPASLTAASTVLIVQDWQYDYILRFDAGTGAYKGTLVAVDATDGEYGVGPRAMVLDADGTLLVSEWRKNPTSAWVVRYDVATGTKLAEHKAERPYYAMAFAPDGAIYATQRDLVFRIDPVTLASTQAMSNKSVKTGFGLSFPGDGRALLLDRDAGSVHNFAFPGWIRKGDLVPATSGLKRPRCMVATPAGALLISSPNTGQILSFDPATGAPRGVFAQAGKNDCPTPFAPTQFALARETLYVSSIEDARGTGSILCFNPGTGAFVQRLLVTPLIREPGFLVLAPGM